MSAAGSIAVTASDIGGGITRYAIAWTSDASGNVSGNTVDVRRGFLLQVKFIPAASGSQPTDQYDVTLLDADGVDLLGGLGANQSNAAAAIAFPTAFVEAGTLTLGVAGAGNAKGGTLVLLIGAQAGIGPAAAAATARAGYSATATFTPAAAAYSAGDVMDVAKQFAWVDRNGVAFPGGELMITSSRLQIATTALQASEAAYTLQPYNVTPPSGHADNDAWDEPAGDRAAYLGSLPLGTPVDIGSTLEILQDSVSRQIALPAGGVMFAELMTVAGFTATAVARKVTLHGFAP